MTSRGSPPDAADRARGSQPGGGSAAAVGKLVLVGFMGAGKSLAARRAGELAGLAVADSDLLLEQQLGVPIAEAFERDGEAAFREREERLVLELLERPGRDVVAIGGGTVESEQVRERLRDHVCVYLEVDPDEAWRRSRESGRPLAREHEAFLRLREERLPLYESVARAIVPPVPAPALDRALAAALPLALSPVPQSVRMLWAPSRGGGYPVWSGEGALGAAGMLWPGAGRAFLVSDDRVWALHGERLESALAGGVGVSGTLTFAAGERSKTLAEAERILRALASEQVERHESLVALGGGVAGDLGGFCAAVYQRGIDHVQVPTTLVSQVDSAYGGKTGVDLPEAKNYVGAFHQPAAVFTDQSLLSTLPAPELKAGYAEVIKTALIEGGALWERVRALGPIADAVEADPASVREVIEGCVRTKLAVVARDERDEGVRASLNLGHTFAHALEAATGYVEHRHGEAVAVGLLVALALSERELGLDESVRADVLELLRRHGLPEGFEGPSAEELLLHASRDKKRRGGRHRVVLLRAPGDVAVGCEVSESALRAPIAAARIDAHTKR